MHTHLTPIVLLFGLAACPSLPETDSSTPADAIDIANETIPDTNVATDPCTPDCDDGNPCTDDRCGAHGCEHVPNVATCDDGNPCTVADRCTGGLCIGLGLHCDDANPCTNDVCIDGVCEYPPIAGSCDDRDACTTNDTCIDGQCVGIAKQCPGDPCTNATCDPRRGCSFAPIEGPCDDGNACTRNDTCQDGQCRGVLALCDDGNPCTDDYCDVVTGCTHRHNRAACEDGDECTVADRCLDGICQGGSSGGCCTDHTQCANDDPCIIQECHDGRCIARPLCDDGDACTFDRCDVGECHTVAWADIVESGTTYVDDFESGSDSWHFESDNPEVGWSLSTTWSASGQTSLYLGNPTSGTYDHGAVRAWATRPLMVPPGNVTIAMTIYTDFGDDGSCLYDVLEVALVPKDQSIRHVVGRICSSGHGVQRFPIALPAGEYELELHFDTRDALDNQAVGVFLDDLFVDVEHACP